MWFPLSVAQPYEEEIKKDGHNSEWLPDNEQA